MVPPAATEWFLRSATSVTAVDAAPEMLARARSRLAAHDNLRFLEADLFTWTPEELIDGADSPVVERRLNDGRAFRVIKIPYEAADLERRLRQLRWNVSVVSAPGPFYWGEGLPVADEQG